MALPEFTLRQLLEAGVHFGHQTHRWNPLMGEYIHSKKNGIHIIDLTQTVPMLGAALGAIVQTVSKGGNILFVGTKRQAQEPIADAAERCAQFYINHRWLGGTLTNWETVSKSIKRLELLNQELEEGAEGLTKKERLGMEREQSKLQASLGGIREMGGVPDILFVIDVKKESLAIAEAKKLGIPVVAIVDTNCSPDGVTYMIPGNDDASRAILLYCDLIARAALEGTATQMGAAGVDIGGFAETLGEKPPEVQASATDAAETDGSVHEVAETEPAKSQESVVEDATEEKPELADVNEEEAADQAESGTATKIGNKSSQLSGKKDVSSPEASGKSSDEESADGARTDKVK